MGMKQIQAVLITGVEVVLHGPIPCQKPINSDLNAWNQFILCLDGGYCGVLLQSNEPLSFFR